MEYFDGNGKRMLSVVTSEFRGLNELAKGREGEFSACRNVSSSEYPCLAVSKGYEKIETDYGRVMAIYSLENGFTGVCDTGDGVFIFHKGEKIGYSAGGKRIGSESEVKIHCLNGVFFIQETTKVGNSVLYKFIPEADKAKDRVVRQCYILNADCKVMYYSDYNSLLKPNTTESFSGLLAIKPWTEDFKLSTGTKYIMLGPEGEEDKFMLYREKEWEYDKWKKENPGKTVIRNMEMFSDNIATAECTFTIPFPNGEEEYKTNDQDSIFRGIGFFDGVNDYQVRRSFLGDDREWHEVAVIAENVMPKVTPMEVYKGRLWCARVDGTSILASASNDTGEDFFYFSGTAASSVYIDSNLPGNFIGVKAYNDSIIAFKENSMTVIYGDTAADFSVGKEICGVGCIDIRSAQMVDGVLYFCSPSGFYAYAGGQPRRISEKLKVKFKKVCAFSADGKYYAEGTTENGEKKLLVYDTEKGIWLSEEPREIAGACNDNGEIYVVASGEILRKKKDNESAALCEWYFESMEICEGVFEKKGIAEIYIKGKLAEGAEMSVQVFVAGEVLESKTFYGNGKIKAYRVPVRLRKDDSYKIKVSGSGEAIIYEMERKVSVGGRNIKNAEV